MANKPVLIAAAVVLLLSIGSLAVAGAALGSVEEDFENISANDYLTDKSTSHQIKYVDDDGAGSAGFWILIEAEATDENDDGLVDECVDFEFTVMDGSEDVTEETSEVDCTRGSTEQFDVEFPEKDYMAVAKICDTYDDSGEGFEDLESCSIGTVYTVQSTSSMMVFDTDAYYIEVLGELGDFLGELLGGSCFGIIGICCGVILLIVGLIMGGNQQPPVMMGGMPTGGMPGVAYQAPTGQMPQQMIQPPIGQPMNQQPVAPVAEQPATSEQPTQQVWENL
ncbi:MAG TPA: hypothetical protein D7H89_02190 [Candidatus Poseidoniales archaeon]|nr:MAG TPA: hypothetical protein D7H89_02190 [Candidatus Poseidoniales archaeon]HII86742.1 hypothetical protein [Candidatus Poseidoniaceae archaeon]